MDFHKAEAAEQIRMVFEVKNKHIQLIKNIALNILGKYELAKEMNIESIDNEEWVFKQRKKLKEEIEKIQKQIFDICGV